MTVPSRPLVPGLAGAVRGGGTVMQSEDFTGLIDVPNLTRFLRERVPGDVDAPLEISRHEAGYSNETFYITRGVQQWVMRRPPRGELLPTAHDVLREYRVLSGLWGTAARIPRPVAASEDPSVIGAPFYLMERVDGIVVREDLPAIFDPPNQRRRIGEEMIDALVELHSVDWHTPALESLGRPSGYLERQLRRWSGQLDLTLPRTRPLAGMTEVADWLRQNIPAQSETTVVQGDYKLDNVCFSNGAPARLLAIFDWEMATLGDPLSDLGWLIAYWGDTGEPPEQMLPGNNAITMLPGFSSREEMVARYEQRSGRSMRHFPFYYTFALWKLTIIIEGLYMHYLEGTAANPRAGEFEWRVPLMIERMHRSMAEAQ
jgi:aminoglycoside phosphotransferase (APT) family kinase protein